MHERTHKPIRVSKEVAEGLNACRESGHTNMFDSREVMRSCLCMGFEDTALWIDDNPERYARLIFDGFEIEP